LYYCRPSTPTSLHHQEPHSRTGWTVSRSFFPGRFRPQPAPNGASHIRPPWAAALAASGVTAAAHPCSTLEEGRKRKERKRRREKKEREEIVVLVEGEEEEVEEEEEGEE
jgi:hypothetical protein